MSVRLTDAYVHKLPFASKGTRYEIRDNLQAGLLLRIGSRRKVFYWDTTQNSKHIKIQLGLFNHTSVEDARTEVFRLIHEKRLGVLPRSLREERQARKPGVTLIAVFEEYTSKRKLRDTTKESYSKIMRLYLSHLANKPVTEISSDDCFQLYQELRDGKSPAKANGTLQLLDSLLRFAAAIHDLQVCQAKSKVKAAGMLVATPARDEMIKASELTVWFKGLEPRPLHYRVLLLTAVLTGFRKAELEKLDWSDFNEHEGTLLARDTKNHRDHLLPIGPVLQQMLCLYRQHTAGQGQIFVDRVDRWAQIASNKGNVRFSMHALRRTFVSIAAKQLGNPLLVKALVNHIATGDVTVRNYVRFELDDLRESMRTIETFILSHTDVLALTSPLEVRT
jgi:integrase